MLGHTALSYDSKLEARDILVYDGHLGGVSKTQDRVSLSSLLYGLSATSNAIKCKEFAQLKKSFALKQEVGLSGICLITNKLPWASWLCYFIVIIMQFSIKQKPYRPMPYTCIHVYMR